MQCVAGWVQQVGRQLDSERHEFGSRRRSLTVPPVRMQPSRRESHRLSERDGSDSLVGSHRTALHRYRAGIFRLPNEKRSLSCTLKGLRFARLVGVQAALRQRSPASYAAMRRHGAAV